VFETNGLVLYVCVVRCIPCDSPIQSNRRSHVHHQHLTTKEIVKNIGIQEKRVQRLFTTALFENHGKLISKRSLEMCAAFKAVGMHSTIYFSECLY
jgi:hypothetical protein